MQRSRRTLSSAAVMNPAVGWQMLGQDLEALWCTHTKLLASLFDLLNLGIRETLDFEESSRGGATKSLIIDQAIDTTKSSELSVTYHDGHDVISFEFGNVGSIDTWNG